MAAAWGIRVMKRGSNKSLFGYKFHIRISSLNECQSVAIRYNQGFKVKGWGEF